jgi:Kef-type K+ transport system membrane component KefB
VRKVLVYSILLVLGLVGSQVLPGVLGDSALAYARLVSLATMACLGFIMIHVGLEFEIDKRTPGKYALDAAIAASAAIGPWLLCALYVALILVPGEFRWHAQTWKGSLLTSLFAAPTSAGVLFSMLAAGGLAATWLFRKARVLAIFDDLVTVLLMIPLKVLLVGPRWQLGAVVVIMVGLLVLAWRYLHRLAAPTTWGWVLGYAIGVVALTEAIHAATAVIDPKLPVHVEVLLPAFVLGCMLRHNHGGDPAMADPHAPDPLTPDAGAIPPGPPQGAGAEALASTVISGVFMVLVGLSMPRLGGSPAEAPVDGLNAIPPMPWWQIALHVVVITALSNLGKMLPALCYRREAPPRHRLALAVGMWPRGEVGAGVLVVAIGYGISGPDLTISVMSLALNLVLTGVFIAVIKRLIADPGRVQS